MLIALYLAYLVLLNRLPPKDHEEVEDVALVARAVIRMPPLRRRLAIAGLFLLGGVALYFVATPFLESMKGLAVALGVAPFVFVQWVAPFLSEFPEKTSAFYWARSRGKAGMALMNMVSSNINQWTVLAAMIPIVYSFSLGPPGRGAVHAASTGWSSSSPCCRACSGMVLLANLRFEGYEAVGLFVLWFAQFMRPDWREEVCVLYAVWLVVEIASATVAGGPPARLPRVPDAVEDAPAGALRTAHRPVTRRTAERASDSTVRQLPHAEQAHQGPGEPEHQRAAGRHHERLDGDAAVPGVAQQRERAPAGQARQRRRRARAQRAVQHAPPAEAARPGGGCRTGAAAG